MSDIINIQNTKQIQGEEPEFYLENTLPIQKQELNFITGKGGIGKSYISLLLLALLKEKYNVKTLGYFSEDALHHTKQRINSLKKLGKIKEDTEIDLIGCDSRPQSFIGYNEKHNLIVMDYFEEFKLKTKDYEVILIDPLVCFIGNEENSNTEGRFFTGLLKQWAITENKTFIIIHHHNKSDTVRGASAFIDACRIHYTAREDKRALNSRFLVLEKRNHLGGKQNQFEFVLFNEKENTNVK